MNNSHYKNLLLIAAYCTLNTFFVTILENYNNSLFNLNAAHVVLPTHSTLHFSFCLLHSTEVLTAADIKGLS